MLRRGYTRAQIQREHIIAVVIIWVVLTAIGIGLASLDVYPTTGSVQAEDFDSIFRILMYIGMPVLTLVFTILGYGIFVWGNRKQPAQDGPAQYGHGWVPRVWLLITGGLAAFVMVWPGLTGLAALQSEYTAAGWGSPEARLTVDVEAQQWAFTYRFFEGICPESLQEEILEEAPGLISEPVERSGCSMVAVVFPSTTEGNFNLIKVPAGEEVKFEIQSLDVLHSFWIPAFRTKIDAIPGRITYMTIEPTIFGSYTNDAAYRVQCAELCGADHTIMRSNIEVVDRDAFDEWIRSVQKDGQ